MSRKGKSIETETRLEAASAERRWGLKGQVGTGGSDENTPETGLWC